MAQQNCYLPPWSKNRELQIYNIGIKIIAQSRNTLTNLLQMLFRKNSPNLISAFLGVCLFVIPYSVFFSNSRTTENMAMLCTTEITVYHSYFHLPPSSKDFS